MEERGREGDGRGGLREKDGKKREKKEKTAFEANKQYSLDFLATWNNQFPFMLRANHSTQYKLNPN